MKKILDFGLYIYLGFFIMVCVVIYSGLFSTLDNNTTKYTNIGFAVFAGIAAICFSWKKSYNPDNENIGTFILTMIGFAGEFSFCGAILFLIASGLKYLVLHFGNKINIPEAATFKIAFQALVIFFFSIAFFCAAIAIFILLLVFGNRMQKVFKIPWKSFRDTK